MTLLGPRSWLAEGDSGRPAASRASSGSPALPETADREPPRHPQEGAHLIRELVRKNGALQLRIFMDVGGGNGTLLAGILGVTPGPRGIVFDLPHVVERAQAHLAGTGVADRCTTVSGDFFKVGSGGGACFTPK